jgi:multidrug efflux pump subunit AcrA (membrane-fusion protein)
VSPRGVRRIVGAAGLVLAGSAAVPAWRALGVGGGAAADVPLFEVERGDFVRRIHAEGVLEAAEATVLGPPAVVTRPLTLAWLAPSGSEVKAGDVVIRFDPTDLERDLREGRFDRSTAESRIVQREARDEGSLSNLGRDAEIAALELEHSQRFESRDERIFSRQEIIESEIDHELAARRKDHAQSTGAIHGGLSGAELDLLAIERRKAELKIERAESGLARLEVKAPHDGIFVLTDMWGRRPEVGQMVWGGHAVAELPRLDRMQAKVYVLEADAGGLAAGLSATVELDARPGVLHAAKVVQADALAQRRKGDVPVQYFGVTLELERTDPEAMKPGQRVRAVLTADEHPDVISVPRHAIFEQDDDKVVYVLRDGAFEPVVVTLGAQGLGRVVVEQGLAAGDRVALRDPTRPAVPADAEAARGAGPVGGAS